jgi:hypothetical protein
VFSVDVEAANANDLVSVRTVREIRTRQRHLTDIDTVALCRCESICQRRWYVGSDQHGSPCL